MVTIGALTSVDHESWLGYWSAYQQFYNVTLPQAATEATWQRIQGGRIQGFGARDENSRLVGFVHFLYHEDTWSVAPACYLQDLYVEPTWRGTGCGRRLIEAVAAAAKTTGAHQTYWLTHEMNLVARRLYDRLGKHTGFIHYTFVDNY